MKSVRCDSNRRVIATLAAIGLCFAGVSTTPAAAPAAPVATGACETTGTRVKVSKRFQQIETAAYVEVIDSAITFTQRRTGCVIVSFSAEAATSRYTGMNVVAVIDGHGCEPYPSIFLYNHESESFPSVRAMNFLCPSVLAGNHIAKMLFSVDGTNPGVDQVNLRYRTMIVQYAK